MWHVLVYMACVSLYGIWQFIGHLLVYMACVSVYGTRISGRYVPEILGSLALLSSWFHPPYTPYYPIPPAEEKKFDVQKDKFEKKKKVFRAKPWEEKKVRLEKKKSLPWEEEKSSP